MFLHDIAKITHVEVFFLIPIAKVLHFMRFLSKDDRFRETKRAVENYSCGTHLAPRFDVIIVCVLCFVAENVIYQRQILNVS